jgi:hypothetical protein
MTKATSTPESFLGLRWPQAPYSGCGTSEEVDRVISQADSGLTFTWCKSQESIQHREGPSACNIISIDLLQNQLSWKTPKLTPSLCWILFVA